MSVARPSGTSQVLHSAALRVAGIALLTLVGAGGLTGCVSADEHKRLQTAHEQALVQLAAAENDLATLRKQIAELNARISDYEKGNSGVDALIKQRDLLQARVAELEKALQDMTASGPLLPTPINNALRDLAAQYPDLMEFDERLGMLRLKSDLTFDLGSTEVKPAAKTALARLAQILNMPEIARNEVTVVGHTDDVPIKAGGPTAVRNPDNWTLSTNRAWAVLDVLRGSGLKQDRGEAAGWGDQRPVSPNAAGQRGNEKNRRVDIYIRPTTVPEGIVVSTPGAAGTVRPTTTRPAATRPATTRPAATRPAATRPAAPATSPAVPMPM